MIHQIVFTKAFTRFHGSTPISVRKDGATIKRICTTKNKYRFKGEDILWSIELKKRESFRLLEYQENLNMRMHMKRCQNYGKNLIE